MPACHHRAQSINDMLASHSVVGRLHPSTMLSASLPPHRPHRPLVDQEPRLRLGEHWAGVTCAAGGHGSMAGVRL